MRRIARKTLLMIVGCGSLAAHMLYANVLCAQKTVARNETARASTAAAEALLDQKVTVSLTDVSLIRAVQTLATMVHATILVNSTTLKRHQRSVTLQTKDETLRSVFERLFAGTTLQIVARPHAQLVVVDGDDVLSDAGVGDSTGAVTGTVVDSATGKPVAGATIRIEGTTLGAITTETGRFTIPNVPLGTQQVSFRLFGYRPRMREVTTASREPVSLRVPLAALTTVLSGVVTTATGTQRKVEIGNDITTLNVDSIMRTAPITSVTDLLENRVPGLTVQRTSGAPGDPARIRLRGAGSITRNNDPIVVVNGIRMYAQQSDDRNANQKNNVFPGNEGNNYAAPSPLDQIDPNSIETIEIFKGPSASAMYGSDAANGVIVITTKRGRVGATHADLTLGQGISTIAGKWPVNYYRFGSGFQQADGSLFCAWDDLSCAVDRIVGFQALNDSRYTVFGQGHAEDASATVSGGSGTLTYSMTGSAGSNVGLLKLPAIEVDRYRKFHGANPPGWMRRPDNYKTWSTNGQMVALPSASVTVAVQSSLSHSRQQKSSLNLGAVSQLQGVYIDPTVLARQPLVTGFVERATSEGITTNSGINASWRALSWLPLTATLGLNTLETNNETFVPYGVQASIRDSEDTLGHYSVSRGSAQTRTLMIGADNIPVGQRVLVAAGINVTQTSLANVSATASQLAPGVSRPTNFPTTSSPLGSSSSFGQQTSSAATYGWFLEPRLNFNSKFFVAPGFRLDGGSASGSNAKLTPFPKLNFSYLAIDQTNPRGIVSLFRPRLAFGYAGTQPGPADRLRLLNPIGVVNTDPFGTYDGTTFVPTLYLTSFGNTQLRPERSSEIEGGADVELWGGRLTMMYTHYNKTRHDAIVSLELAPSVSALNASSQVSRNIGVVRNTGTEVSISAQVLQNQKIAWNVSATSSRNANLVVRLNRGQAPIIVGDTRIVAGYPLFGRWARPIVAFGDANHNGTIEFSENSNRTINFSEFRLGDSAVYIGQQEPKYMLNVVNTASLWNGRIAVSATVAYVNGLTQFNADGRLDLLPNAPGASLAQQAAVQAAKGVDGSKIGLIQTVNTLRFSSLSVNYNVPKSVSRLVHVPVKRVALQGNNLGLHSNYRGKDPNVNAFSTGSADRTQDSGTIPQPRTWRLQLQLGN